MNNFLRILLATIIIPAYLIADEADEPTSPAKPDEVEVKENDEEEVENDSEDSEDKTYLIDNLPALSANYIFKMLENYYPVLFKGTYGYVAHEA